PGCGAHARGSQVRGRGVDPAGARAITPGPGARVDVVGVASEQQGIAVSQLIEGERLQLVVDEVEMPPIHVVDHSIEADERRVHDPSHGGDPTRGLNRCVEGKRQLPITRRSWLKGEETDQWPPPLTTWAGVGLMN